MSKAHLWNLACDVEHAHPTFRPAHPQRLKRRVARRDFLDQTPIPDLGRQGCFTLGRGFDERPATRHPDQLDSVGMSQETPEVRRRELRNLPLHRYDELFPVWTSHNLGYSRPGRFANPICPICPEANSNAHTWGSPAP